MSIRAKSMRVIIPSLKKFEIQVLAFPVLTTTLCCASFFFGRRISAWQWWISTVIILGLPWATNWRKNKREAFLADVLFVGLLATLWCLSPLALDRAGNLDFYHYHLPQIHYLALGWNPIDDPLCQKTSASTGLSLHDTAWVSAIALPKTTAIFNACAHFFVRDALATTLSATWFLLIGFGFAVIHSTKPHQRLAGVAGIVVLAKWLFVPYAKNCDLENCLILASGGLLFTMLNDLRRNRLSPLPLFVFTFWMVNSKLTGVIGAVLFWSFFATTFLLRNRKHLLPCFHKLFGLASIVIIVFCLVSFNPYGIAWRDYGHPLYPCMTSDAQQWPLHNIPGDCKIGNDDWKSMGHFGTFVNAYVSPSVAHAYYRWKTGKNSFDPHQYIWDYEYKGTNFQSPLTAQKRGVIWLVFLVLVTISETRVFSFAFLLGLGILPKEYIGYLRYAVWIDAFKAMAVVAAVTWILSRFHGRLSIALKVTVTVFITISCFQLAESGATNFRRRINEETANRTVVYAGRWIRPGRSLVPDDYPLEGKPRYLGECVELGCIRVFLAALGHSNAKIVVFGRQTMPAGMKQTLFRYAIEPENESSRSLFRTGTIGTTSILLRTLLIDYPIRLMLPRKRLDQLHFPENIVRIEPNNLDDKP